MGSGRKKEDEREGFRMVPNYDDAENIEKGNKMGEKTRIYEMRRNEIKLIHEVIIRA